MKVSIAMFSTFTGESFKAPYLQKLALYLHEQDLLCKCYGMADPKDSEELGELREHAELSKGLRLFIRIAKKIYRTLHIPPYPVTLLGETLMALIFSKKIMNDGSEIVYIKQRACRMAETLKKNGKIVVVEASEAHPRYTSERMHEECSSWNFQLNSVYMNEKAVRMTEDTLKHADYLVCLSEASKKTYALNGFPEDRIFVVNLSHSFPEEELKDRSEMTEAVETSFFCTAYHSILKGTHRLLENWRKCDTKAGQLYIIGSLDQSLKRFVRENGPYENVVFTGALNKQELLKRYGGASRGVGISLSLAEGFSRTTLEYLLCGLPVIVTPISTCDFVEDGVHGRIVEYNDDDKIQQALNEFLNMSKERYNELAAEIRKGLSVKEGSFENKLTDVFKALLDKERQYVYHS